MYCMQIIKGKDWPTEANKQGQGVRQATKVCIGIGDAADLFLDV